MGVSYPGYEEAMETTDAGNWSIGDYANDIIVIVRVRTDGAFCLMCETAKTKSGPHKDVSDYINLLDSFWKGVVALGEVTSQKY